MFAIETSNIIEGRSKGFENLELIFFHRVGKS
jgi:hypothetical protein